MQRVFLALILLSSPLYAWAQEACDHEEATVTCAEGTTLDEETGECVLIVS